MYFSNGCEGMDWVAAWCDHCKHQPDDPNKGCPLQLIQAIFNYDQLDKGQEKLKEVMDILGPEVDGKQTCAMFIRRVDDDGVTNVFPQLKP